MLESDGRYRKHRQSYNEPGHAHELTFSCYRHLPMLSADRTRQWLVDALDHARHSLDLELWAYVIMPEHVHVLIVPRRDDYKMAEVLKAIKQPVAQRAIRYLRENVPDWLPNLCASERSGHAEYCFWQPGGGYDRNICCIKTAWASVQYLHQNPVRRGLVNCAEDWEWSSARWYAGQANAKLAMDGCPPTTHRALSFRRRIVQRR